MNMLSMRTIRGNGRDTGRYTGAGIIQGVGVLAMICLSLATAAAQTPTTRIVKSANAFLSTLDAKQRQSVMSHLTTRSSGHAGPICR
jgi:hypothetical protein